MRALWPLLLVLALWSAIAATAGAAPLEAQALALQPRHETELRQAVAGLEEVCTLVEPARTDAKLPCPELVAASLRRSLDATASLAGELTPDDILGRIFSSFCIGK